MLSYSCLETRVFPVDLYINPVPSQSPAPFLFLTPFQSTDSRYAPVLACKSSPKQLLSISRNSMYVAVGNLSPSCLASAPLHGPAPAVTLWTVPVASLPRGEHQGWDVACNPQ